MSTNFTQAGFDAWLLANSKFSGSISTPGPLAERAASMPDHPVVANGILTGLGAQAALGLDAAYVKAHSVAALQQSPVTGCSMLLTLAREKSGYNPTLPAQSGALRMFFSYVDQILVCPMFSRILNDRIVLVLGGDWNNVINQIATYYVGIPPADIDSLKQSLINVARAASSNPSTNQTLNMFSQATICVSNDTRVYMYYTEIKMKTTVTPGGKHEPDRVSNQADLSLNRVVLLFDSAQWPAQAAAVYKETQQSLADWLADNSTPNGALPMDWHPR